MKLFKLTPLKAALFVAAFTAPAAQSSVLNGGFEDCKVATSHELDEMRGGFEFRRGWLKMSFGLERLAYVNGAMVARTTLNFPSTGSPDNPAATQNGPVVNGPIVVQNGPNNYAPTTGLTNQAMIIQNTLDNTQIGTQTILNITLNSMALARGLAVTSSLGRMLSQSIH